jgi:hypothetical protein
MATPVDVKIEGGEMAVAATPVGAKIEGGEAKIAEVPAVSGGMKTRRSYYRSPSPKRSKSKKSKRRSTKRRSHSKYPCPGSKVRSRHGRCVKKNSQALSVSSRACKVGKVKRISNGKPRCVYGSKYKKARRSMKRAFSMRGGEAAPAAPVVVAEVPATTTA